MIGATAAIAPNYMGSIIRLDGFEPDMDYARRVFRIHFRLLAFDAYEGGGRFIEATKMLWFANVMDPIASR